MKNDRTFKESFLLNYQFKHVCFEGIGNSVWYLVPDLVFGTKVHLGDKGLIPILEVPPLKLKSLSSITDEDAFHVGCMVNCWAKWEREKDWFKSEEMKETHILAGQMFAKACDKSYGPGMTHPFHDNNSTDILTAYDYLRSRGYALPWLDITIEDLINFNWIIIQ